MHDGACSCAGDRLRSTSFLQGGRLEALQSINHLYNRSIIDITPFRTPCFSQVTLTERERERERETERERERENQTDRHIDKQRQAEMEEERDRGMW